MFNKRYVQEVLRDILSLKVEDICILNSYNELKPEEDSIKFYTVYLNPKIKSDYLEREVENIYPFSHMVDSHEYVYSNLSEEEIKLLEEILLKLDINVSTISRKELTARMNIIQNDIKEVVKKVNELKLEVDELEQSEDKKQLYLKEKKLRTITEELKKLKINI